jgi:hypothetical protein
LGFFEADEEDALGFCAEGEGEGEAELKLLRKLNESFKRLCVRSLAALLARAVAISGFRFVSLLSVKRLWLLLLRFEQLRKESF